MTWHHWSKKHFPSLNSDKFWGKDRRRKIEHRLERMKKKKLSEIPLWSLIDWNRNRFFRRYFGCCCYSCLLVCLLHLKPQCAEGLLNQMHFRRSSRWTGHNFYCKTAKLNLGVENLNVVINSRWLVICEGQLYICGHVVG